MRSWIAAFTSRYKARTGRDSPVDHDYFNGDLAGLQRLALG